MINTAAQAAVFFMEDYFDKDALINTLRDQFNISSFEDVEYIQHGYFCHNFAFSSEGTRYFLKQYREKSAKRIPFVKRAEQFFSDKGIPIILPLQTKDGQPAFKMGDHWYSLFPFIFSKQVHVSELTPHHIASIGMMHARLHQIGKEADLSKFSSFTFWNREDFFESYNYVKDAVTDESLSSELMHLAMQNLDLQAEYVQQHKHTPQDYKLDFDALLHGDFIYTNIFFDEQGSITHVYDVERTGIGPRAYDLARSIFITCFDDGWHEKNYEFARMYMKAYQSVLPITKEEFAEGAKMYVNHFMHMTWMESSVLLGTGKYPHLLVRPANARLHHFLGELDFVVDQIFVP